VRDDGFHINIPHPFTILKYLIFYVILFPWFRMFEKKQPLSSVYDKYVTPCDCQCPIIKTNKTTNQTDDNGKANGWFGK
jgi:hypothetical protein